MTDLRTRHHGSVVTFEPLTVLGRGWISENLATESWQWLGPVLGVDHRFAHDIIDGAINDGLEVDGD